MTAVPVPPAPADSDERIDAVLIIQARDVTLAEWDQITATVERASLPLSIACHVSLHAAVDYVAERVMEAFDGT